jgi:hypothetical protein
MSRRPRVSVAICLIVLGALLLPGPAPTREAAAAAPPESPLPDVSFAVRDGSVELKVGADVVGTYVYDDPVITRPHFRNLRAPGGAPVTRAHPPVEGVDATDHADMHPGAWLAFGDIGGADVWRNKAKVRHVKFVEHPAGGPGRGTFTVANEYGGATGEPVVCDEVCRYTLLARPAGYLLVSDSTLRARHGELSFGDQEEMGFGVRVATGMTVKAGGRIVDSEGRENEAGIWGKPAAWVDYSGTVAGGAGGKEVRAGVMLIPHAANPHPSRFHVRDYGLMVANPFGRTVFGDEDGKRVSVPAGEDYRLRFAVLLHASPAGVEPDLRGIHEDSRDAIAALEKP